MAATFALQRAPQHPSKLFSVLLDNSYPAGGYPVTPANVGLVSYVDMLVMGPALATAFLLITAYDPTTGKIRVFYPTGGATAAPATVAAPLSTTGASTASAVNATTGNEVAIGFCPTRAAAPSDKRTNAGVPTGASIVIEFPPS